MEQRRSGSEVPTPPDLGCGCKMQGEAASIVQAARCLVSGEGQIGLQKACADPPWAFPRLIRIAPQVVAGGSLEGGLIVWPLSADCALPPIAEHRWHTPS